MVWVQGQSGDGADLLVGNLYGLVTPIEDSPALGQSPDVPPA
jgi:hypothetical protein